MIHGSRLRLYTMPCVPSLTDLIKGTNYLLDSYGMDARNEQDLASWVQRMVSDHCPPPSTWMLHRENWYRLAQNLRAGDLKIVQFTRTEDSVDPDPIRRTELWVLTSRRCGNMKTVMVQHPLAALHIALTCLCLESALHYMIYNGTFKISLARYDYSDSF
jgi:hypothetical protein